MKKFFALLFTVALFASCGGSKFSEACKCQKELMNPADMSMERATECAQIVLKATQDGWDGQCK